jgi:tRNA threonylcarbamoyladenosine biosynthesis protein TsaB
MRSTSKNLLAIDTSTRVIGLALYNGAQVFSEWVWASNDHHTTELAPAIQELLGRAHQSMADLGAIGVALGPGSFTGLRIGLALAKGIALVQRIPVVGIPTLEVLAQAQPPQDIPMAAVLRAGRGRLAVGWYEPALGPGEKKTWQSQSKIEVLTPQDLSQRIETPTLVCGELTEEERQLLARKRKNIELASPAVSLRRPSFLAELAWNRWQAGDIDDPASLTPIYLHYNDPVPG